MYRVSLLASVTLFAATSTQAQLVVDSVIPVPHAISAPVAADMVVNFTGPVDPGSIGPASFRVFGRWSGPAGGSYIFENANQTVRFRPNRAFQPGEWVVVSIASSVSSPGGGHLEGYSWGFWTATASASLDLIEIGSASIRQSNEGAIVSYGAYAGDLNRDGWTDLSVPNENPNDLRVFLNDGAGNYPATFFKYPLTGTGRPSPNEGADFDNDGDIDLAVGGLADTKVSIMLGDGAGAFPTITGYDTVKDIRGLCVVDYDADGDEDLVVTGRGGNAVGLLTNDGAAVFSDGGTIEVGDGETSCAVADANDDGKADLFIGTFFDDTVSLLLGDGNGGFTRSDAVTVPGSESGSAWMLAAGDINGDGFADVASVNANRNTVSIIAGDGAGHLSAPVNYATGRFALAVDLADVDGDGDLDLAVSNHTDATWYLYENDGNGAFPDQPRVFDAVSRAACAIFHDRDNDGDLDMTGIDEGEDVLVFFETRQGSTATVLPGSRSTFALSVPYPNPSAVGWWVDVSADRGQDVRIDLLDALGRVARRVDVPFISPGTTVAVPVDGKDLPAGVYFIRAVSRGVAISRPLVRVPG